MKRDRRPMWQFPWRYRESFAFVVGLIVVGFMLQFTVGRFDFYLLHYPVNLFAGAALIVGAVALSFVRKNSFVRWLSSSYLTVALLTGILFMSLFMGLIPQVVRLGTEPYIHWGDSSWGEVANYINTKLGFKQMTSHWSFVLLYGFILFDLLLIIGKRAQRFRFSDYAFYLLHFGLWLTLFAAGLGAADLSRYVMWVEEGEVEWRVYDHSGEVLELELAIELHQFIMEEYDPKLVVVDAHSGAPQPERRPDYYQIDNKTPQSKLSQWELELKEYLPLAIRQADNSYVAAEIPGSAPAAYVVLKDGKQEENIEGWVTCGSYRQFMNPLEIDSTYLLMMTQPEPKRFASDITIIPKDGKLSPKRVTIEVNSPAKVGNWHIYQYDYDSERGRDSKVSVFELVYDPWLSWVIVGIVVTMVGCVVMLWMSNKKRGGRQ